ncbi:MAG: hypothetical protein QXU40_00855 [Candidatus Pacearchaeota archaeon]
MTNLIFCIYLILLNSSLARVIKVGPGYQYSKIQEAINFSIDGDTIKVLPGIYTDAIAINKNIVLQGSGYEVTKIITNTHPAVSLIKGKIMWLAISSITGNGIEVKDGIVTNCVITACGENGVLFLSGASGSIKNSVIVGNNKYGVIGDYYTGYAINCIADGYVGLKGVTYCIGTGGNTNIYSNPNFEGSDNFHLLTSSPGIDAGNPIEQDPDGSRCDIGYFGGIDCPIFPVVTLIKIIPLDNGQIKIQATANANY